MRLVVNPGPPLAGTFRPPGDKSVTHRAYLFGLLARGTTRVEGANSGEDCARTLRCAEALGAAVRHEAAAVEIRGVAGSLAEPEDVLDCGNSGTALRLLAGALAAAPVFAVLSGDASLRSRPVARVIAPLRAMGATLSAKGGDRFPPLAVRGGSLAAAVFAEPTASAQVAGAVALAALGARGTTSIAVRAGVRDHTERMLPAFGARVGTEKLADGGRRLIVEGGQSLTSTAMTVPGDFSAAAFFLAAAAATPGAAVTAEGVSLNPTRCALLAILSKMGARVDIERTGENAGEDVGRVTVTGPARLEACDVPPEIVPSLVDEIPAWAVAASAARGTSRLAGAAELRVKESDRLAALALNLSGLGIAVAERPDGLEITGGPVRGGSVAAGGDHRIAMAFAVLGARASGPIEVDDASSIATSFPGFLETFLALGGRARSGSERA